MDRRTHTLTFMSIEDRSINDLQHVVLTSSYNKGEIWICCHNRNTIPQKLRVTSEFIFHFSEIFHYATGHFADALDTKTNLERTALAV